MSENENLAPAPDDSSLPDTAPTADSSESTGKPRRNFMTEILAVAIGGIVSLVPAVLGGLFFLDPILRRGSKKAGASSSGVVKDEEGFIRLALTTNALPVDGTPQKVTVFDDIVNVWNKFPNQPIGSVWLRRIEDQVLAFSTICPHLGCAVEHRDSENEFYCPCHLSSFELNGEKKNPIPPRAMDSLEVKLKEDGFVWLKYQEFRGATSEKVQV